MRSTSQFTISNTEQLDVLPERSVLCTKPNTTSGIVRRPKEVKGKPVVIFD
jgi:hypothetical protein